MTREEKALDASKRFALSLTGSDILSLSMDDMCFAFQLGIKWADNNPKSPWIIVKDDLPCNHEELISLDDKIYTLYVVAVIHGIIILSRMYKFEGKWYWENDEPTHWMPIPELPK